MSHAHVTIAYDGEALRDNAMDVRDLAPALLAVGQLFDSANLVLNRDDAQVKVQVKATGSGSFEILLQVAQTFGHQLTSIFAGEQVTSAVNLKELIFGFGGIKGLIWLIKKLKGRVPDKIEKISDNLVKIQFDGETFEVPLSLMRLYQDIAVRVSVEKMISEPLRRDGIDTFEVRENKASVIEVHKEEGSLFERPKVPEEVLLDETRKAAFSIISLAFKEENKWRLSDGSSPISALIEDKEFLDKVDTNQIAFAKGDVLICEVRIRQTQDSTGLHTVYVVEKVVEHRPAMRQLRLFDDEQEHEEEPPEQQVSLGS